MSEPVGNAPRDPAAIPSNTLKDQAKRQEKVEREAAQKEPVAKIIEGKVVVRKKAWYRRAASNMIADDASSIGQYVMEDVVFPALKNLVADVIGQGTNRVLFGSSAGRRRTGVLGGRESLRTRYDQMGGGGREEPRRLGSAERARHSFADIILSTRGEATEVLDALLDRVSRFGVASVSDMYDFVGVSGSFADRRYGWTDLRDADVRQVREGFVLELPRPELLR